MTPKAAARGVDEGSSKRRAYHHGNLKTAAIEAAVDALTHKMPSEISLRDLAKTIGVGHSALYAHFSDRDELFAIVSEQGFERLKAEMRDALAEPGEKVAALSRAYLRFARERPAHYRAMFRPSNIAGIVGHKIDDLCDACMSMLVEAIMEMVGVSAEEGERRAVGVWCALHGLVLLADRDGPLRQHVSAEVEKSLAAEFACALARCA